MSVSLKKLKLKVYGLSPALIQDVLLSLEGRRLIKERFGVRYEDLTALWDETQWYSTAELEELQNEKLRLIVRHAYETVPYYRRVMDAAKLTPGDITTVADLQKLPVLTKDDVRRNMKDLISTTAGKGLLEGHSSGTTGSPIDILYDKNTAVAHNAAIWRNRRWVGFDFGTHPYASLLGRVIVPIDRVRPPFWRYNRPWKQLFLSSFHLREENLPCYFDAMDKYDVQALQAYPSTAYILARYLEQKDAYFPLKYVFTSSETLLDIQREVIEERFRCRVLDNYGLAEKVAYAGECQCHEGHHLFMEYGVTEIVDEDNMTVDDGEYGRMVCTGLHNLGMPLIRYDVGDVSAYKRTRCSCGRGLKLLEPVTTKAEDIVVTPSGRFISSSVLTHPFKPMNMIERSQIIQETPDRLTIRIVKRPGYTSRDTEVLLKEMYARVGDEMRVDVEFVKEIPLSRNGKYRWVISRVPLRFKKNAFKNLYE